MIKRYFYNLKLIRLIGLKDYLILRKASFGSQIRLSIRNRSVLIRKGTPDLEVAISCFSGEFDILSDYFPKDYKGVIVDAGGYIGTSAIAFHKLFPSARIIVLEPSADNLSILKKNLEAYPQIEIKFGALVGGDQKFVELKNRNTGEWGFSIVENPLDAPAATVLHKSPAFRLYDLVDDIRDIGLIKLDIEGGEYDLLKNDAISLAQIPVILIELHERIVSGCEQLFKDFSANRLVRRAGGGEKFLSLRSD